MFENLPDVVTPKQLAEFLQVSELTIKRALKSEELKGFKVGRDWRIEKKSIVEWIENKNKGDATMEKYRVIKEMSFRTKCAGREDDAMVGEILYVKKRGGYMALVNHAGKIICDIDSPICQKCCEKIDLNQEENS